MNLSTTPGDESPAGNSASTPNSTVKAQVHDAAQFAHRTVDDVVDGASTRVGRASGAAHRAVDTAAEAAATAADWAANVPDQAKAAGTRVSAAACASIRARPLSTVAGALVVGYLVGRLARH